MSVKDIELLEGVVRLAVDHPVFGMMAVLDGVRALDDQHTGFYLRTGDGSLLNDHHDLHDMFRSIADQNY